MPSVTWVTFASSNPMGQQHYESEIQRALTELATGWRFRSLRLSTWRTEIAGARRVPSRLLEGPSLRQARLVGGAVYRTRGLVHRFDLRLPPAFGREVVTAHDLPPLRFPDEGSLSATALASARLARIVICPSEFAADELRALAGVTTVAVIPYGVSRVYESAAPASDADLLGYGITGTFVVHAAGASARKNLPALAQAWRAVAAADPEVQLALCGPPDPRRDEAFAGVPQVLTLGRLPAGAVASLMRRAAAVVVPSVYEGFGLPALEGMICGVPVVAARAGALPEVVGDAGLLVAPDADGLAEGLLRVLGDAELAEGMAARGATRAAEFSWELAARRHLEVYEQAQ